MSDEKVIKIKGPKHGWYKEAVFVVEEDVLSSYTYKDIQQRADVIIGNHAKRNGLQTQEKNKRKSGSTDQALNVILASSICILIICLYLL